MIQTILVILATLSLAHSQYSVSGNLKCIQRVNATGLCNNWEISSSITPSCFPADALVTVMHKSGAVRMADLEIGDKILGFDHTLNALRYSPFTNWIHFEKTKMYDFIEIETVTGSIVVSPYHNIAYVSSDGTIVYDYAKNHQSYTALFNDNIGSRYDTGSRIIGTRFVQKKGIYSPLTLSRTFFVSSSTKNDVSSTSSFLVHSFAHVSNPQMIELSFNPLYAMLNWFSPIPVIDFANVNSYIDPNIETIMKKFGAIVDADFLPFVENVNDESDSNDKATIRGRTGKDRHLANAKGSSAASVSTLSTDFLNNAIAVILTDEESGLTK